MTRPLLSALLLGLFLGCGPANAPPPAVASFFPKDNEVSSWAEDTSLGKAGVEVATSAKDAEALVNGDAAPFNEKGMVTFAWERYQKGAQKLDLRVWQFKDSSACTDAYLHLVANVSLYKANTWTALELTEAGRIADTGSSFWVNARKGSYLVEAKVSPKDGGARSDVEAIAASVLSKIP